MMKYFMVAPLIAMLRLEHTNQDTSHYAAVQSPLLLLKLLWIHAMNPLPDGLHQLFDLNDRCSLSKSHKQNQLGGTLRLT